MGLPKRGPVKPTIPLNYPKTLLPRREEIKDMITKDGTYLPKSLLHADLDRGFLDFVKEKFNIVSEGKKIPVVDILITTQNWSQFVETWDFQNIDKNLEPPFLTVIRNPDVKLNDKRNIIYPIIECIIIWKSQLGTVIEKEPTFIKYLNQYLWI
jgi:hypothetical protein